MRTLTGTGLLMVNSMIVCLISGGKAGPKTSFLALHIMECMHKKLDMSGARRRLKSLSGTFTHLTMVTQKSVTWSWMDNSFHGNRPAHSWDKAISNSDLKTSRSRSWLWSKGKVIQSDQYLINSHPYHFTSIRPTIPEIQLFTNLFKNPESRSCVRSKVNVTKYTHTQYPTEAQSFLFHITRTNHTIPEIWSKECLNLKNTSEFFGKFAKKFSNRTSSISNQRMHITMGI